MFTGIIEATGVVKSIEHSGTNLIAWIESGISNELKIDQSVSHDGVCLTVDQLTEGLHRVTIVSETLSKTNLGHWNTGHTVNLERSMIMNGRLDGHIVQGHVDSVAICRSVDNQDGSWLFRFSFPAEFATLIIEKGSVCINGVSLTLFDITKTEFSVAIIPFTHQHTNFGKILAGDKVNIEFDVIGKYINRMQQVH